MPKRRNRMPFLLSWMGLAAVLLLTSCGEFFEFEGFATPAGTMTLDRHEVNIMVGDSLLLTPIFDPDTLSNGSVYWMTDQDGVVEMVKDSIVALAPGSVLVTAMSVSAQLIDTCRVNVMPVWQVNPLDYLFDMVVYADVSVHGLKPDSTMVVGAFCGDELRGIGEARQAFGIDFMEFRIWSQYRERDSINFRCYHHDNAVIEHFPDSLAFDGEMHGSPSNLFKLVIE